MSGVEFWREIDMLIKLMIRRRLDDNSSGIKNYSKLSHLNRSRSLWDCGVST